MFEGITPQNISKREGTETLSERERREAHEKAMKELEEAFVRALASGYITGEDIKAAETAARERADDKNIQIPHTF